MMIQRELDERRLACEEARLWVGTPFLDHAERKGSGVDCLGVILAAWRAAGVLREFTPEEIARRKTYPAQWHIHSERELYIEALESLSHRVTEPGPGDAMLFHPPRWLARTYACAAVVVEWPACAIESSFKRGVILVDPSRDALILSSAREHPHIFFSPWPKEELP